MKHIQLFENFSPNDAILFGSLSGAGIMGSHPVFFTKSAMDQVGFTKYYDEWINPNDEEGLVSIEQIQEIKGNPSKVLIASLPDSPFFKIAQPSPEELSSLGSRIEEGTPEYERAMQLTGVDGNVWDEVFFEVVPVEKNTILWSNAPESSQGWWERTDEVIDLFKYIDEINQEEF